MLLLCTFPKPNAYSQIHIKSAASAELSYIVVVCVYGGRGVGLGSPGSIELITRRRLAILAPSTPLASGQRVQALPG